MDPLPLREQKRLRRKYRDNPEVQSLLKEIKRIRTRYVGTELTYLSPIAERTGRRVKIHVHRLNEDAAHFVVTEGIKDLLEEVGRWKNTPITRLAKVPRRIFGGLEIAGYNTISELLQATEGDLLDIPGITYNDVLRVELALSRLGCKR